MSTGFTSLSHTLDHLWKSSSGSGFLDARGGYEFTILLRSNQIYLNRLLLTFNSFLRFKTPKELFLVLVSSFECERG